MMPPAKVSAAVPVNAVARGKAEARDKDKAASLVISRKMTPTAAPRDKAMVRANAVVAPVNAAGLVNAVVKDVAAKARAKVPVREPAKARAMAINPNWLRAPTNKAAKVRARARVAVRVKAKVKDRVAGKGQAVGRVKVVAAKAASWPKMAAGLVAAVVV
jgi:hypothetical protein